MEIPKVTDLRDLQIWRGMNGCRVGKEIILPSGLTFPAPPPDKVWLVQNGTPVLIDKPPDWN